jgi:hypothetical protein
MQYDRDGEPKPRYQETPPHVVTAEAAVKANALFADAARSHDRALMLTRTCEKLNQAAEELWQEVRTKRSQATSILLGQTHLL